jgi:3,4-dihydroxy 2-butanone 4-phosphate synthase/GTP cyclohydrolase II
MLGVGEAGEGTQVANSLRMIEREGRGVVVLIRDLRPRLVSEWIASRVQPKKPAEGMRERRQVEIGIGSQILADLGVRDMVLLTNSPAHVYVGVEGFGLHIVGTRRIE